MNQYELALKIMSLLANQVVCSVEFGWSEVFIKNNLVDTVESIKNSELFTPININEFTESQLVALGFGKWDESKLSLIPMWIVPFTTEKFIGECISGEKGEFLVSEIDKDTRFGCLAYGVYPVDRV